MKGFIEVEDMENEIDYKNSTGYFEIEIHKDKKDLEQWDIIKDFTNKHKINFWQSARKEQIRNNGNGLSVYRIYLCGYKRRLINIEHIKEITPYVRYIVKTRETIVGCIVITDRDEYLYVTETYEEIKKKIEQAQGENK